MPHHSPEGPWILRQQRQPGERPPTTEPEKAYFEAFCQDLSLVKNAVEWFSHQHDRILTFAQERFPLDPAYFLARIQVMGFPQFFPLKPEVMHTQGTQLSPTDIAHLAHLINQDYRLLFQLDQQKLSRQLPLYFQTHQDAQLSPSIALPRPTATDLTTYKQLIGLPHLTETQTLQAAQQLSSLALRLKEQVYWYYSIQQVRHIISFLAPSLTNTVKHVTERLILFNSPIPENLIEGDWGLAVTSDAYAIKVQSISDECDVTYKHFFRLYILVHETMHAITAALLSGRGLDIQPRGHELQQASLYRMLTEGISIAFEQETYSYLQKKSQTAVSLSYLDNFQQLRRTDLKTSNALMNDRYRHQLADSGQLPTADLSRLLTVCYSEGVRLGLELRRGGWTVNHLPQLIDAIAQLVRQTPGAGSHYLLDTTLSSHPQSQYQQFVSRLGQLSAPDLASPRSSRA